MNGTPSLPARRHSSAAIRCALRTLTLLLGVLAGTTAAAQEERATVRLDGRTLACARARARGGATPVASGTFRGFALKDIISNFVSGLLILALRPFNLGDQIVVGDTEGSVERIELRATAIRT